MNKVQALCPFNEVISELIELQLQNKNQQAII